MTTPTHTFRQVAIAAAAFVAAAVPAPFAAADPPMVPVRPSTHPSIGRCTIALPATQATVEVQIPDAADFCELVPQALADGPFYAPMAVTYGRLWHYAGAVLSCRLRYRHTRDRITVHNSDAACRWLLRLSPGWHSAPVSVRPASPARPLRARRERGARRARRGPCPGCPAAPSAGAGSPGR